MPASTRDKVLAEVTVYQLQKAAKDIRGKAFLRVWREFVRLWSARFKTQSEEALTALDEEP